LIRVICVPSPAKIEIMISKLLAKNKTNLLYGALLGLLVLLLNWLELRFVIFEHSFEIGLFISLIASTIYVIGWLINYYFFIPDFMDKYAVAMLQKHKPAVSAQMHSQRRPLKWRG
jgi:hypothetical protein